MMVPDVFSGEDAIGWPHEYLALKFNRRLALAKVPRNMPNTMQMDVITIDYLIPIG
jgi:hypothetical protein